ncbi:hypothetical protein J4G08_00265 [Candidatus Poribacteria bacterium]|nr:hypothetical protein [Candidatus Poribacteria bacterium]
MQEKVFVIICVLAVLIIAGFSIVFTRQPVHNNADQILSFTAAKAASYKKVKKKNCSCCEDKAIIIKQALQRFQESRQRR